MHPEGRTFNLHASTKKQICRKTNKTKQSAETKPPSIPHTPGKHLLQPLSKHKRFQPPILLMLSDVAFKNSIAPVVLLHVAPIENLHI
ncbi:Uncharacterized protein TCM_008128 [Theobroma cacao]|uniref:Uncharacterized protein n=1 Tax=Theobroma cacao TaxID=3641 RepID=A0A061E3B1_THECC|nr:Uncharacterized protein TCM_008128 [Theobroma cacao]